MKMIKFHRPCCGGRWGAGGRLSMKMIKNFTGLAAEVDGDMKMIKNFTGLAAQVDGGGGGDLVGR